MSQPLNSNKLTVWSAVFLVVSLVPAVDVSGLASLSQQTMTERPRVPEATRPCSADEASWWQQIRAAADDAVAACLRKDEAIRKRMRELEGRKGRMEELFSPEELAKLAKMDVEIASLKEKFLGLLRHGLDSSYKAPVPDNIRPVLLYTGRPDYTEEARKNDIQGNVRIRVEFRADGMIGATSIISGLGYGLDEQASETMRRILFLPAIKDGAFVSQYQTLEASFNLR